MSDVDVVTLLATWRARDNRYALRRRDVLTQREVEAIVEWRKSEANELPIEGRARALAAIAVEWGTRLVQ